MRARRHSMKVCDGTQKRTKKYSKSRRPFEKRVQTDLVAWREHVPYDADASRGHKREKATSVESARVCAQISNGRAQRDGCNLKGDGSIVPYASVLASPPATNC